ncbi:MAG: hypothetical protein MMC23_007965 [Stictis urceolatum]|nr:hypothetical protein [Stictis urceolata]
MFLDQPNLALHVQDFELNYSAERHDPLDEYLCQVWLDYYEKHVHKAEPPFDTQPERPHFLAEILEVLKNDHRRLPALAILAQCHNIRFLKLSDEFFADYEFVADYCQYLICPAPKQLTALTTDIVSHLQHLEHVAIKPKLYCFALGLEYDISRMLFALPKVPSLELSATGGFADTVLPWQFWYSSHFECPTLEELTLRECHVGERALDQIFAAVPDLAELTLQLRKNVDGDNNAQRWFYFGRLGDSIRDRFSTIRTRGSTISRARKLEKLVVKANFFADPPNDVSSVCANGRGLHCDFGLMGEVGSLRGLSSLTHLAISIVALLGWSCGEAVELKDVLLDSLRYLKLNANFDYCSGYDWLSPTVFDFSARYVEARGKEANLEHLVISVHGGSAELHDASQHLRAICEECGVSYEPISHNEWW